LRGIGFIRETVVGKVS